MNPVNAGRRVPLSDRSVSPSRPSAPDGAGGAPARRNRPATGSRLNIVQNLKKYPAWIDRDL